MNPAERTAASALDVNASLAGSISAVDDPTVAPPAYSEAKEQAEINKARSEARRNRAETALKLIEAQRLKAKPTWVEMTVPGATVIVALVGFLGTFAASYVKGWYDLELTKQKQDSELLLKVVSGDVEQSRRNLRFLLEAGLLKDSDGKIASAIAKPSFSFRIASVADADLGIDLSDTQLKEMVSEIQRVSGITVEVAVQVIRGDGSRLVDLDNAWARKLPSGKFVIEHTPKFLDKMRRRSNSNWAAYAVLAHEYGHIALKHLDEDASDHKKMEIEADEFSGRIMAKLGATLEEATILPSKVLPDVPESPLSPSSKRRGEAFASGWKSGSTSQR